LLLLLLLAKATYIHNIRIIFSSTGKTHREFIRTNRHCFIINTETNV